MKSLDCPRKNLSTSNIRKHSCIIQIYYRKSCFTTSIKCSKIRRINVPFFPYLIRLFPDVDESQERQISFLKMHRTVSFLSSFIAFIIGPCYLIYKWKQYPVSRTNSSRKFVGLSPRWDLDMIRRIPISIYMSYYLSKMDGGFVVIVSLCT